MTDGTTWHGDDVEKLVEKVAMEALRDIAETVLTKSMNNVPLDTGTLRRSGTVTIGGPVPDPESVYEQARDPHVAKTARGKSFGGGQKDMKDAYPDPVGTELKVYVSYNTPYARRQHEDMALNHKEGGPKFLENAFNAQAPKAKAYIQKMIQAALQKGR